MTLFVANYQTLTLTHVFQILHIRGSHRNDLPYLLEDHLTAYLEPAHDAKDESDFKQTLQPWPAARHGCDLLFVFFRSWWCCTCLLPTSGQPSGCIEFKFPVILPVNHHRICQHLLAMMPKTGGRLGLDMKTPGIINLPPHSETNPGRNRSNGPLASLSERSWQTFNLSWTPRSPNPSLQVPRVSVRKDGALLGMSVLRKHQVHTHETFKNHLKLHELVAHPPPQLALGAFFMAWLAMPSGADSQWFEGSSGLNGSKYVQMVQYRYSTYMLLDSTPS